MQAEAQRYAAAIKPLGRAAETRQDFAAALFDAARPLIRQARVRTELEVKMLDAVVAAELPDAGIDPEGKLGLFARERVKELAMLPWQLALFKGHGGTVPLFEERWTGTNGDSWNSTRWPTIETSSTGTFIIDIQSNEGRLSSSGGAYKWIRLLSSSGTLTDFEITGTIRLSTVGEQYHSINFRHTNGWKGSNPDRAQDGYTLGFFHFTSDTFDLIKSTSGTRTTLGSVANTWGADAWNYRIQVIGTALKVKVWQGAEPGTWDIEVTDSDHSAGIISMSALNGNASTARPAFWDNLVVQEA